MTIAEIKARLSILHVLAHYGLVPDARRHVCCPFHPDRTPSMQVRTDSNTVRCYSSNCPHVNKTIDVIDFVMHKEACTKAEAIARCKAMAGALPAARSKPAPASVRNDDARRRAVLMKAWAYMRRAVAGSPAARAYLDSRGLDRERLAARGVECGYQTGQMHHGARSEAALIASLLEVGLLCEIAGGRNTRSGGPAYRTFAKASVAFALRDEGGAVAGLYFRSIDAAAAKARRHLYLRDRRGLFPRYPGTGTRRLLLCESVIDAASALLSEQIAGSWAVLALYGTAGFTAEHARAVAGLEELEEACVMLDGDQAGRKAAAAVAARLRDLRPGVRVTAVELPDGADGNGLLVAHGAAALAHYVEERVAVGEATAVGGRAPAEALDAGAAVIEGEAVSVVSSPSTDRRRHGGTGDDDAATGGVAVLDASTALDASDPLDIGYRGRAAELRVKGLRCDQADTLKLTLQIRVAA